VKFASLGRRRDARADFLRQHHQEVGRYRLGPCPGRQPLRLDSEAELQKIAAAAPGARVFCRILVQGEGALWPLNRKFGCEPDMAADLLIAARGLGLEPYGVSFHVGSQQLESQPVAGRRQWREVGLRSLQCRGASR